MERNQNVLHCPTGTRPEIGRQFAWQFEALLRDVAPDRTEYERQEQSLCRGCSEIIVFYMAVALADMNKYSRADVAESLRDAFQSLKENPSDENVRAIEAELEALNC